MVTGKFAVVGSFLHRCLAFGNQCTFAIPIPSIYQWQIRALRNWSETDLYVAYSYSGDPSPTPMSSSFPNWTLTTPSQNLQTVVCTDSLWQYTTALPNSIIADPQTEVVKKN